MTRPLFEIDHLRCSYDRRYREGVSKVVLQIDRLTLPAGQKIFIVGESGIGKSTILEALALMNNTIVPGTGARIVFHDREGGTTDLAALWQRNKDRELSAFRRKHFNFIFQSTHLMRNFTAYENVSITRMLQGHSEQESFRKAEELLRNLGLGQVDERRMAQELSGGQQQRLALARGLLPEFTVLFGDEPTGNLDSSNAARALELLSNELQGRSAIIVTHDMGLAVRFADIIVKIRKNETASCGVIRPDCLFVPSEDRRRWSNGEKTYDSAAFESFLKTTEDPEP